jgi:hypothetical protein
MRDDDNFPSMKDQTVGAGRAIFIGLLVIAVCAVLGWVVWGMTVATSDIKGRGDQQIQNNSAVNRTFQYEHFLQLDGTIRSQAQIADAARAKVAHFEKTHPNAADDSFNVGQERSQIDQDATGAEQICQTNVAQYNNEAQSFLRAKFVDSRLPASFPSTVCTDVSTLPPSISGQR